MMKLIAVGDISLKTKNNSRPFGRKKAESSRNPRENNCIIAKNLN